MFDNNEWFEGLLDQLSGFKADKSDPLYKYKKEIFELNKKMKAIGN